MSLHHLCFAPTSFNAPQDSEMISTHVPEGKYYRLHIRVRAEGCGFGRTVGVGGSCKALGYGDTRKVLPLVTTPESYPIWYTTSPVLVPAEELLTYKFCIIEGGQFKAFEDLPSPRSVIPTSVDTIVENIFNPSLIERSVYDSEARLLQVLDEKTQEKDTAATEDIGVHGSLYLLCYHLPVVVERTNAVPSFNVTWGDSLIARTDGVIADAMRTHWVGAVRVPGPPLSDTERAELVGILLRMSCVVIFVDDETSNAAYFGYCKQVLWPVFHNVDQLDSKGMWPTGAEANPVGIATVSSPVSTGKSDLASEPSSDTLSRGDDTDCYWNYTTAHQQWWKAYLKVNQMFCDSIKDRLHPQDVVWIHDYHLMMLPGMLRSDTFPSLSIVFYLHIPFPTSQVSDVSPVSYYLLFLFFAFCTDFPLFTHRIRDHEISLAGRRGWLPHLPICSALPEFRTAHSGCYIPYVAWGAVLNHVGWPRSCPLDVGCVCRAIADGCRPRRFDHP